MKKKMSSKWQKLTLHRDTLCSLDAHDLRDVQGAGEAFSGHICDESATTSRIC